VVLPAQDDSDLVEHAQEPAHSLRVAHLPGVAADQCTQKVADQAAECMNLDLLIGPVKLWAQGQMTRVLQMTESMFRSTLAPIGRDHRPGGPDLSVGDQDPASEDPVMQVLVRFNEYGRSPVTRKAIRTVICAQEIRNLVATNKVSTKSLVSVLSDSERGVSANCEAAAGPLLGGPELAREYLRMARLLDDRACIPEALKTIYGRIRSLPPEPSRRWAWLANHLASFVYPEPPTQGRLGRESDDGEGNE